MAYIVIKAIKGRRYAYEQRSYREGKRVRTESRYLGPVDGSVHQVSKSWPRRKGILRKLGELIAANTLSPEERARVIDENALLKEIKAREAAEQAARDKALAELHELYGLRVGPVTPVPVEKPPSAIDYARLTALSKAETAAAPPEAEATAAMPTAETEAAAPATEGPAGEAAGPEGSE